MDLRSSAYFKLIGQGFENLQISRKLGILICYSIILETAVWNAGVSLSVPPNHQLMSPRHHGKH